MMISLSYDLASREYAHAPLSITAMIQRHVQKRRPHMFSKLPNKEDERTFS